MNDISDKERTLLHGIYEKIIQDRDTLKWSYMEGAKDELSRAGDQIYNSKIANLDISICKGPPNDSVTLTISSGGDILYDAANDVNIDMMYTYLDRRRIGEEEQKREQAEQERCTALEQLLDALEQPKKAKKAGRKK